MRFQTHNTETVTDILFNKILTIAGYVSWYWMSATFLWKRKLLAGRSSWRSTIVLDQPLPHCQQQ